MSRFAAFGRKLALDLCKPVHGYRRLLPSGAWHEENNRIGCDAPDFKADLVKLAAGFSNPLTN
jgi:hypothetical protein